MMISLDCETTGVDLYHGAAPFLVTICEPNEEPLFWEWPVDPLTRDVLYDLNDLDEIQGWISRANKVVCQNGKFDVAALKVLMPDLQWPWERMEDTLIAGHLLRSDWRHDLTSMVMQYLGVNILKYETAVERAVKEARRLIGSKKFKERHGVWRIAKEGLPEMPSAKGETWRADYWLPLAVARAEGYPLDHEWRTALSEYACADSASTLALWQEMERLLRRRGLCAHYRERMRCLPIVHEMERDGIPICHSRMAAAKAEFSEVSGRCFDECVRLSGGTLDKLPVNGRSKALDAVVFGKFGLRTDRKTDSGEMSMDKHVIEGWLISLDHGGDAHRFVKSLRDYRRRQTAMGFMASYEKYGVPACEDFSVLHPSLNMTGTRTLRWSSHGPNEQQISKQEDANLRDSFGPLPGEEWWAFDAQNIELRIPAYESGEPDLIALFERPKDPPYYGSQHLLNFSTVYPDIWEQELHVQMEVKDHVKEKYADTWYQWVKNGGFAIQYQAGNVTADQAFRRKGSHALLKERFSKLEALNQKYVQMANHLGYVETTPDRSLGMTRGYPLYCPRTDRGSVLSTLPLNYHVQSTAMWWMMRAMIRVREYIRECCLKGTRIVAQVHDELVIAFPKGKGLRPERTNLRHVREIQRIMAKGGEDIDVVTPVSAKYHPVSWRYGTSV